MAESESWQAKEARTVAPLPTEKESILYDSMLKTLENAN